MTADEDTLVEILAEISALRFVVEIVIARDLATVPADRAEKAAATVMSLARGYAILPDGMERNEIAKAVAVKMTSQFDRHVNRALDKAKGIRDQM